MKFEAKTAVRLVFGEIQKMNSISSPSRSPRFPSILKIKNYFFVSVKAEMLLFPNLKKGDTQGDDYFALTFLESQVLTSKRIRYFQEKLAYGSGISDDHQNEDFEGK